MMLECWWLKTTFWHEDSYKAQKTKYELRKKQEKKQHFHGIDKKLFIFPQIFFSKKKMELKHLQKQDKLSLQVTIFKHVLLLNLNWKKKKKFWTGCSIWRTVNLQRQQNKLFKTVNQEMEGTTFKSLITPCVLRRQHHLFLKQQYLGNGLQRTLYYNLLRKTCIFND